MRIASLGALLFTLLLPGASVGQTPEEFTPPTGRQPGAGSEAAGVFRMVLATSSDGLTFTRSERVLSDQAGTPSIAVTPAGRILVYYTGAQINGAQDGTAVAVSDNNGATWRFFRVRLLNFPANLPPLVDPDVLLEANGTFRLYLTGAIGGTVGVYAATSTDGFNFTYAGIALQSSEPLLDSLTQRIGNTYHMYVLRTATSGMVYATSSNGTSFSVVSSIPLVPINGHGYFLSNWMAVGDGTQRIYAFAPSARDIRSVRTTDGAALTAEAGARLTLGGSALESDIVRDSAVARMADGRYLMVYATKIPADAGGGAPAAPASLTGNITNGLLTMQWATGVGGGVPTSHLVEAGTAAGLANIGAVAAGAGTTFQYAGVPPGRYFLRVRAVNSAGTSTPSNELELVSGSSGVPAAPQNLAAQLQGSALTLTWTASAGAASYVIEAGTAAGASNAASFDTGTAATTFFHPAVPRGQAFFVRVRARGAAGVSGPSNEVIIGPIP